MKKHFALVSSSSTKDETISNITENVTCSEDLEFSSDVDKCNMFALLHQGTLDIKSVLPVKTSALNDATSQLTEAQNALSAFITQLCENNPEYIRLRNIVNDKQAVVDSISLDISSLNLKKKSINTSLKLLSNDKNFIDLVNNETTIGIDLNGVGGSKILLKLKEDGTSYRVVCPIRELLDRVPGLWPLASVSIPNLTDDANIATAILFAVNHGLIVKETSMVIKADSKAADVNNFPWTSDSLEESTNA